MGLPHRQDVPSCVATAKREGEAVLPFVLSLYQELEAFFVCCSQMCTFFACAWKVYTSACETLLEEAGEMLSAALSRRC